MANDRCPSCGAAVRAGDPWCTLCWTDLRPPPPAPEPVVPAAPAAPAITAEQIVAPAVAALRSPGGGTTVVDPLSAPLAVVLGEAPATEATTAAEAATWPCVECGARNALDADACSVCTAPFGGRINRLPDPKEHRRKVMLYALGAVGAFLMVLALLTFAFTDASNTSDPSLEPTIDWSTVPRE